MSGESWVDLAQQMTVKIVRLERDLAASQAREQELRAALRLYPLPKERPEVWAKGASTYLYMKAIDEFEYARAAAIARPSDTSALHEFGLKVAERARREWSSETNEQVVDLTIEGK